MWGQRGEEDQEGEAGLELLLDVEFYQNAKLSEWLWMSEFLYGMHKTLTSYYSWTSSLDVSPTHAGVKAGTEI